MRRPGPAGRTPRCPPERLGDYLRQFSELMGSYNLDALVYGHFGDGCVHARIDFPFRTEAAVYRRFVTDAAILVAKYGGSMSGEHGDGRARSELLPFMYSPEAIALFGQVKAIFDRDNVLNPGVIANPAPLDDSLRVPAARPMSTRLGFAYAHDGGDFTTAVHRCVGVGKVPRRHDRRRRGDVPVLPGHARREGLDPRPGPGVAGTRERFAGEGLRV